MNYTPEQTKENRNQLSDALRSGKYQQHVSALTNRTQTAFCCLGVACEISGLGEWKSDDNRVEFTSQNEYSVASLVPAVQAWLGFRDRFGTFFGQYNDKDSLANLNDSGAPFEIIANVIDSEPRGLIAN